MFSRVLAAILLVAAMLLAPLLGRASVVCEALEPCPAVIYVVRRGWHTDVGFAVDSLSAPLDRVARKIPEARYLFFGFGDRRYLMATHQSTPDLLRALWPGAGIILVTGLGAAPSEAFGNSHVIQLRLSQEQFKEAQRYVWDSLADQHDAITLAEGPYAGSLYLAAAPRYSALHTCNTWTAEILGAAELPVRSRGVLFAGQVWRKATKLAVSESNSRPLATPSCRVVSIRSDTPPWFLYHEEPRPSFSPEVADCCY